jgi:hypothetical protein
MHNVSHKEKSAFDFSSPSSSPTLTNFKKPDELLLITHLVKSYLFLSPFPVSGIVRPKLVNIL